MKNLTKAIIAVMAAVKGVEKNLTVGTGGYSYKGVADKDVKQAYSRAMQDNGLCILPVDIIENELQIDRWQEKNGNYTKNKQQVFCSVTTKYELCHTSGESKIITGYGHGVDTQDKSAAKATTYALKFALLYTFMAQTGDIEDTDNTHSEEIDTPPAPKKQPKKQPTKKATTPTKPTIPVENYEASALWLQREGNTWPIIEEKYKVSAAAKKAINAMLKKFVEADLQNEYRGDEGDLMY